MLASILLLLACISAVIGQEETLCRGQKLNMSDEKKGVISDCLVESGIDSVMKIPPEKFSCFGLCVFERKNFLNPDGKINRDVFLSYVNEVMKPDEVKPILVAGFDKCLKEHGDKVRGKNDPTCTTFVEVGGCIQTLFLDVCVKA